jgi:hypothetical protein
MVEERQVEVIILAHLQEHLEMQEVHLELRQFLRMLIFTLVVLLVMEPVL